MMKKLKYGILTGLLLVLVVTTGRAGIKQTKLDIEDNNDYSSFSMLDSVVKNYTVFFTGENHLFRKSNYQLQLKMMKYLVKKAGVRHLFLEFGHSRGWLVNQYVQTGDTSLFSILDDYSYDEYALLYKGLYEFNKTLDSANKIMVHGIDTERSLYTPIKVMSMLLPDKNAPDAISLHVDALKGLAVSSDLRHSVKVGYEGLDVVPFYTRTYSNMNSLKRIMKDFDSNTQVYRDYIGDNFADFERVMNGVKAEFDRLAMINQQAIQDYNFRENFMYKSFMGLIQQYPGEKFYSQFGRCHTGRELQDLWCGYYYYKTLAYRLNSSENAQLNNKVLSIGVYYPEAYSSEFTKGEEEMMERLNKLAEPKGLTLFEMGEDSTKFDELFQYVIINKNSQFTDVVTKPRVSDDEGQYSTMVNFEARYGATQLNFSKLNTSLFPSSLNSKGFDDRLWRWGGAITVLEEWGTHVSFYFDKFNTQKINYNDSTSIALSGFSFGERVGSEFTMNQKFNITVFTGFGFSMLKLAYTEKNSGLVNQSIFGVPETKTSIWRNPAPLLEVGMDFRLNLAFFTLGFNGGYQLDCSRKQWRTNGSIDADSPKTSLSGLFLTATAGFFFGG